MSSNDHPQIDDYRILRVIGHGGMSTVYLAEQVSLGRKVALKVMLPEVLADEVSRGRFENEARTIARQAQEQVTEATARLTLAETRLSEVALQRHQLEELMQSLSRSRDENLVVDVESAIRVAQQQAQLTGSLEPLVAALKSAQQRIERAAQPRLAPVQRAIGRDLERLGSASVNDTTGLLAQIDELVRQVDDLPVLNAVAQAAETQRMKALMLAQVASGGAGAGAAPPSGSECSGERS